MKFDQIVFIYNSALWIVIGILFIILLIRTLRVVLGKQKRIPLNKIEGHYFAKTLKFLFALSMLLAIINAIFVFYIASAFKIVVHPFINHLLVLTVIWLAAWELFLSFSISRKLLEKTSKKVILSLLVIVLFGSSVYFVIYIPQMFEFPDEKECLIIEMPVEGAWVAGSAGGTVMMNMHNNVRCQWYAIDMVKLNDKGSFYSSTGNEVSDHVCFQDRLYSPVSGTIVSVVDSLENAPVSLTNRDTANPAGNHVVIKVDEENYIFLAHLDKQSILVEKGDVVRAGDPIGKIGNTGNTTWPHLHIHLQDMAKLDYKKAKGKPFRFKNISRKRWLSWEEVNNAEIIRNDLFRPSSN